MSPLHKMLFIFMSASVIHFLHGLDQLNSTELLRLKRHHITWQSNDFSPHNQHHPVEWGNNGYAAAYNHHHPIEWGNNGYTSYNQHHPIEWGNNGYTSYNQHQPLVRGNNEHTSHNQHHPIEWGNNKYTSHNQHQPIMRGNNEYTSYNHPIEWGNIDYSSYNQHHPVEKQKNVYTSYNPDYDGAWGSFDITISNGKLLDRQLFPEDPSSFETQVDRSNSDVIQKSTPSTSTPRTTRGRRISELKCIEYLQNRKAREESKKIFGNYFIIGGRFTKSGEFPHMGAVGWKAIKGTWIFICGSSLISTKFMLTAAHCSKVSSRYPNVANRNPEIVRLGDRNIVDMMPGGRRPYDIKIRRIIVHEQYAPPRKYFDIAIIELMDNVKIGKTVQPACLWTNPDTSSLGSKATVTGWGVIEAATLKTITDLQAADVDILTSDVCDDLLRPLCIPRLWCGMSDSQLCAGILRGGTDACQGDSGGPLQVNINSSSDSEGALHYLIGITSFGNGCAQANNPAVYTRISSFIDWIEKVVWGGTT